MELPSPPPWRTVTTCTDMSWPPATPSASLTPVLPDLSSRGLSSIPATARGPLSPSTAEWLSTLDMPSVPLTGLLRVSALDTATDMGSTATARGPLSLSMGQQLLLRTRTDSMDTSLGLGIPSASPILATLALPSPSRGSTPTSSSPTAQASATKDLSYLFCTLLLPNTY